MTSSTLTSLLEEIQRLEPFPTASVRVLELALVDAAPREIASVIEVDPGLTVKVLRLANSATYAARQEVSSIYEASARLGVDVVASLAMTSGCAGFFMGYGASTPRSNAGLWNECLHVALYARHLASERAPEQQELAYTVGLLQNMGHVVLDRFLEEEKDAILECIRAGADPLAAERDVLGMDHAACGARMAKKWDFPPDLVAGIRCHHNHRMAAEGRRDLCALSSVAEGLAVRELREGAEESFPYAVEQSAMRSCGLGEIDVAELRARVRAEVDEVTAAMA